MNEELYLTSSLAHFPYNYFHFYVTRLFHGLVWGYVTCLASTLDYAGSTYPLMKGMLIVTLEGEVENTEVQPKPKYGNRTIWKSKYESEKKSDLSVFGIVSFHLLRTDCVISPT